MESCAPTGPMLTSQQSAFLNLPPEIRNRVYQAALIKPGQINLCPSEYVHDVRDMQKLACNVQGFESFLSPKLLDEFQMREQKRSWKRIRVQRDLLYIRQELAVGLLRTCRQIYLEAAGFFWSGNTWCFSHDMRWHLLFRFLSTIGSNARARIKTLEIFAPMAADPMSYDSMPLQSLPMKSHPKLRMARPCPGDEKLEYCDCRARTFELLMRERTLEKITFIVPGTYCIYTVDKFRGERIVPQDFLSKVSVVVEPGAFLDHRLSVEDFTNRGVREALSSLFSDMGGAHSLNKQEADLGDSLVELECGAGQSWRSWYLVGKTVTLKPKRRYQNMDWYVVVAELSRTTSTYYAEDRVSGYYEELENYDLITPDSNGYDQKVRLAVELPTPIP